MRVINDSPQVIGFEKRGSMKSKTTSPTKSPYKRLVDSKKLRNMISPQSQIHDSVFPNTQNLFNLQVEEATENAENEDLKLKIRKSTSLIIEDDKGRASVLKSTIIPKKGRNDKQASGTLGPSQLKSVLKAYLKAPNAVDNINDNNFKSISDEDSADNDIEIKNLRVQKVRENKQKEEEDKRRKILIEKMQKQAEIEAQMKGREFDSEKMALDFTGKPIPLKKVSMLDKNDFTTPKYELRVKKRFKENSKMNLKPKKVVVISSSANKDNKTQSDGRLLTEESNRKTKLGGFEPFSKQNTRQIKEVISILGGNNYE